ncbi:hypothetical protein LSM04_005717 [Trypanosoma melophagium]|uniref:uncharacterized protein n=1 Tax=Trypanosoma melophagium TaxID=715481 RepID=UPI00351A06BA|nr:hypothetical protein LSM04_005717 [Trypanosoma melophagium]
MTAFCGTAFHTPGRFELEVLRDVLMVVNDTDGTINRIVRPSESDYANTRDEAAAAGKLITLGPRQFLIPGLIDLHNHAPQ